MKRETSADQLNATLDMLKSWSLLYDRSDHWPEVCQEWADLGAEIGAAKWAMPLLDKVFLYTNEKEEWFPSTPDWRKTADDGYTRRFTIDFDGILQSIGDEAATLLGLRIGDNIQAALAEPLTLLLRDADSRKKTACLAELVDCNAVRRLATVEPSDSESSDVCHYNFTLCRVSLPDSAERYLKETLSLTTAEIDILTRSFQRQDLQSIAASRKNTVNTIRTHIRSIIKKFGCKSFTDVIVRTHEIISLQRTRRSRRFEIVEGPPNSLLTPSIVKLAANKGRIEYLRYGAPNARPLIVFHSLEYGYGAPQDFINEATRSGYAVYTVLRPGFGRSSPASSIRTCAEMLNEFLASLQLNQVTLVACSTSAPIALNLHKVSNRTERCVVVNYGFNVRDKIRDIKPKWLQGLLKLSLASNESFKFALRMTTRMCKVAGYKNFYKKLYSGCTEDLGYLEANPKDFEFAAAKLVTANPENVRLDLITSFRPNTSIPSALEECRNIISIHGENTHSVPPNQAAAQAAKYDIPFHTIEKAGRNCVFQRPKEFFQIMMQDQFSAHIRAHN